MTMMMTITIHNEGGDLQVDLFPLCLLSVSPTQAGAPDDVASPLHVLHTHRHIRTRTATLSSAPWRAEPLTVTAEAPGLNIGVKRQRDQPQTPPATSQFAGAQQAISLLLSFPFLPLRAPFSPPPPLGPQGSRASQPLRAPCRPGFSQNFYTVIVSRDKLHGQSILKGESSSFHLLLQLLLVLIYPAMIVVLSLWLGQFEPSFSFAYDSDLYSLACPGEGQGAVGFVALWAVQRGMYNASSRCNRRCSAAE